MQQTHNYQREMMQKQRQQRQAIDLPITNQQQNTEKRFWRGTVHQNAQENARMKSAVISKPASPGYAIFTDHPKVPQISYERHSPYVALPRNYEGKNVATPVFHHDNPQSNSHSMISPKLTGLVQSSQYQSQVVERNKMPAKPPEPLPSVPQAATPLWHQSNPALNYHSVVSSKQTGFAQPSQSQSLVMERNNVPARPQQPLVSISGAVTPSLHRSYLSSHQGVEKLQTNVNSKPRQNNPDAVRVISQPSHQISSTGTNIKLTYQSGIVPSKANISLFTNPLPNHLQAENNLNAPLKTDPPPIMSTKTAAKQQKEFQLHHENPKSLNPNKRLNATTEMERRTYMANEQNVQSQGKPNKKEKLFYFPIKRDTLVEMLLSNLQEKFRSLRETKNVNSSSKTSGNKGSVTAQDSEAIKLKNIPVEIHSPAKSSGYGYPIIQRNELAPKQSKSETLNSSTTIDASQASNNPNYIFSPTNFSGYGYTITPPKQSKSETINSSRNILKKYFEAKNITNTATINAFQAPKSPTSNFSAKQTSNSQPTETSIIEEYKPIPL